VLGEAKQRVISASVSRHAPKTYEGDALVRTQDQLPLFSAADEVGELSCGVRACTSKEFCFANKKCCPPIAAAPAVPAPETLCYWV
jgi:hypothetical protein